MSDKLKPCPFCGGGAKLHKKRKRKNSFNYRYWYECDGDCWESTEKYHTEEEARSEWNRKERRRMTMRNCENCYHYHMCDLQNRLEEHQDCKHYKDKSLIVELPCKVGDDLYWISGENKVECLKNAIIGVVVKNDGFEILDADGNRDKIGSRYAYLTREEAEKALAEMELK